MIVRAASHAMGTRFEVVLSGDDPNRLRTVGEAALEEVADWDGRLSLFQSSSFLSFINANAGSRPVELDDDLFELIAECLEVHAASGGAFDVTVAPLMRAWGFHGDIDDSTNFAEPELATIPVGSDGIELDHERRTVRFLREGMALDFGGIGKGHALDCAKNVLFESGIECALMHGGTSTVIAIGAPEGGDGWRIALQGRGRRPVAILRDAALSVSAPHGRTIEIEGETLGHVIDPTTGRPVTDISLAAVIAPTARLADAWSTALLVCGKRPPGMPVEYTTLIERLNEDGVNWTLDGPQPELFFLPERCDSATEVML